MHLLRDKLRDVLHSLNPQEREVLLDQRFGCLSDGGRAARSRSASISTSPASASARSRAEGAA